MNIEEPFKGLFTQGMVCHETYKDKNGKWLSPEEVDTKDGKIFFDCSTMSVGTNSLGYGNYEVDNSVHKVLKLGNMSTLNCPEEVILAKK